MFNHSISSAQGKLGYILSDKLAYTRLFCANSRTLKLKKSETQENDSKLKQKSSFSGIFGPKFKKYILKNCKVKFSRYILKISSKNSINILKTRGKNSKLKENSPFSGISENNRWQRCAQKKEPGTTELLDGVRSSATVTLALFSSCQGYPI